MSMMDNELFDTFGEEYKTLNTRVEQLEKVTNGDLIVMPDGTTYTMADLGLLDVSIRVFYQSDAPTGMNSSTHVGDIWIDSDDGSQWFWDGLSWVSKAANDKYVGGTGLEALGPGVVARLLTSIDITSAASAPSGPTWGDVWRDTSAGNIVKRWNGSAWITITDQNIINAVGVALSDPIADVSDGGIRVFYTTIAPGGMNASTHKGDIWYDIDDNWKKYIWNGALWANPEGSTEDALTDGLPPSFSPVPSVGSGIGSLFITWDAVPNADPIWYLVYIDDVAGVALTGANYVGQFFGEVAVVQRMPDDTPLLPNTTYYVKIVAMDADGAAAPSAEASGSITLIDLDQFEADLRQSIENIDTIQQTADGKNTNYYQTAMPTGGTYTTNDEWFDTDDGYKPYRWDGTTWQPYEWGTSSIAANSITSVKIATGAITAAKISAGTITSDKLAANIITADAIVIGTSTGSNSIMNPSFETNLIGLGTVPPGWARRTGIANCGERFALSNAPDGSYVLRILGTNDISGSVKNTVWCKAISVEPGARFTVSMWIASSAADSSWTWQARVIFGTSVSANTGFITTQLTESIIQSGIYSTTWQYVSAQFTVPANAIFASVLFDSQAPSTQLYVDNVRLVKSTDSVLIADGAVLADKIAANAIIADKIAANAITSDKLSANSVIAGKIAANAITASNIQSGQISATHIQSFAITSTHLQSGSVTAGKINAGAIDGMSITGAYIQTHSGTQGVKISTSGIWAYNSSGGYAFFFSTGSSNMYLYGGRIEGGLFRSSTFGQFIEIGDTGFGDPVDEIRMFNNGGVTSIRHLSGWLGYIYFNLWGSQMSLHYTSDGWNCIQRGTSGPMWKFVSSSVQARNGSDTGYIPVQGTIFQNSSHPKYKREIVSAARAGLPAAEADAPSTAEVIKRAGLKKWKWTEEFAGVKALEARDPEMFAVEDSKIKDSTPKAERIRRGNELKQEALRIAREEAQKEIYGLVSTDLPEFLQEGDGYVLSSVLAFLWEALKESNQRIEELEKKNK